MSTEIDNRIVQMQFNNRQFESGVRQSMSSIRQLKSNLNFDGATASLNKFGNTARGLSFSPLEKSIESVKLKFSALEVAGIAAITNITNKVVDMSTKMLAALTIDPVKSGLSEYEEKMDNVQTTIINSGKSLEEVNATLDDLNHYADKTIYKFSDMTSALSKFTMAGITDLETASNTIKGIGNAAGEAGLKAQQASSVYYMLSQAMSTGKLSLYQFRTLETTGFASAKFRNALLDTAEKLGKIKKNADGLYEVVGKDNITPFDAQSIRDSLTKGEWVTKGVLTATLDRYASKEASIALGLEDISEGAYKAAQDIKTFSQLWDTLLEAAQSGWSANWEIIIGDYEEAKKMWGSVNEVLSGALDNFYNKQKEILTSWKELGGRENILKAISNAYYSMLLVVKPLSETIKEFIPSLDGKKLADISKKIYDLSGKLIISESTLEKLQNILRGFLSIGDIAIRGIKELYSFVEPAIKKVINLASNLFSYISVIGKFIYEFNESLKRDNVAIFSLERINAIVASIKNGLSSMIQIVIGSEKFEKLKEFLNIIFEKLPENTNAFSKFASVVSALFDKIIEFGGKIAGTGIAILVNALASILSILSRINFGGIIKSIVNGSLLAGLAGVIAQISHLLDPLNDIGDVINDIKEDLMIFGNALRASGFEKIAIAIGIFTASLIALSMADPDKLGKSLLVLAVGISEMMIAFKLLPRNTSMNSAINLVAFSASLLIMASALSKLAGINGNLAQAYSAVLILSAVLASFISILELVSKRKLQVTNNKIPEMLISMSVSLLLLVPVIKALSKTENIETGIIAVAGLITFLTIFAAFMDKVKIKSSSVFSFILLAGAIEALVLIAKQIGKIITDINNGMAFIEGLGVITALIGVLSIAAPFLSNFKFSSGVGFVAMALALNMLVLAIKSIAKISDGSLNVLGSIAMLSAFLALIVAIAGATKTLQFLGFGAGLLVVAVAVDTLAISLLALSQVDFLKLLGSVIVLAGVLAGLVVSSSAIAALAPAIIATSIAVGALGVALILLGLGIDAIVTALGIGEGLVITLATGITGIKDIVETKVNDPFGIKSFFENYDFGKESQKIVGDMVSSAGRTLSDWSTTEFFKIKGAFGGDVPIKKDLGDGLYEDYAGRVFKYTESGRKAYQYSSFPKNNKTKEALPASQEGRGSDDTITIATSSSESGKSFWQELEDVYASFKNADGSIDGNKVLATIADKLNLDSDNLTKSAKEVFESRLGLDMQAEDIAEAFGLEEDEIQDLIDRYNSLDGTLDKTTDATNEAAEAAKKLREEYESSIKSSYGRDSLNIFTKEFEKKTDLTAEQMLNNMQTRYNGVREWTNNITALAARGLDSSTINTLIKAGAEGSYEVVNAMINMTDDEFRDMISYLSLTDSNTSALTDQMVDSYDYAAEMAINGWSDALDKYSQIYNDGWGESISKNLADAINAHVPTVITKSVSSAVETSVAKLEPVVKGKSKDLGNYIYKGVESGISDGTESLQRAVRGISVGMEKEFRAVNMINSPAKVYEQDARWIPEGIAKGITDGQPKVVSAIHAMSQIAIDAFNEAIDAISSAIHSRENEIVLRPVLDLSEIQNGANTIDSMFSGMSIGNIGRGINNNIESKMTNNNSSALKELTEVMSASAHSEIPIEVNVTLDGDTGKIFKVVRSENTKFVRANGYNPLLTAR